MVNSTPFVSPLKILLQAVLLGSAYLHHAMASTDIAFGSLSNFDVFCVTESTEECHGFEIELEGIHCEDISRTFGGTYSRYGVPNKNPVLDDQGNTIACVVEYSSSYDSSSGSFSATTLVPNELLTGGKIGTNGHQCYLGGMNAAAYDSSGCEHFGVSLRANPTKTSYYWLVADSQNQGQLKRDQAVVGIPAVTWSANNIGGNVVVRAEIEPPEQVFACARYGDAQWVKVNVTELEVETELEDLLSDNQIIVEAESEVEWKILQAQPTCDENGNPLEVPPVNEFAVEASAADGSKTVIRRYEFFEYSGNYDPENHEVIPEVDEDTPQEHEIGNYLGSQMAAINFDAPAPLSITTSNSLPSGTVGQPYTTTLTATGGVSPYTWNAVKEPPSGLTLDSTGIIQGTPITAKAIYKFRVKVTDSDGNFVTKVFTMRVDGGATPLTIMTKAKLPNAKLNQAYSKQILVSGGTTPYTVNLLNGSSIPSGITVSADGLIQGTPGASGLFKLKYKVTDSNGAIKRRVFKLRVVARKI